MIGSEFSISEPTPIPVDPARLKGYANTLLSELRDLLEGDHPAHHLHDQAREMFAAGDAREAMDLTARANKLQDAIDYLDMLNEGTSFVVDFRDADDFLAELLDED